MKIRITIFIFCLLLAIAADADQDKGKLVYVQEGCINCHSQFVRPDSKDIELWGPYVDYKEVISAMPPLIGNRRQGPDLLNVGLRRSQEWLKIHMLYPQATSPGSRMPSYEYLFKDSRGDDLVEYLASLGKDRFEERSKFIYSWEIKSAVGSGNARDLYTSNCSHCHNQLKLESLSFQDELGTAAKHFNPRPRNFKTDALRYINLKSPSISSDIARIIKFGLHGTSMPGHEFLTEQEIINISQFLLDRLKEAEESK